MAKNLNLTLRIWRQDGPQASGRLVDYQVEDISDEMSFLEMLDVLNERLIKKGEIPVEFDSDCREGICGTCGLTIDGVAHGPVAGVSCCQLHMRHYQDGDTITIEPFRAAAFPVIRDLVVDRSAFDRIVQAGGYVGINTGNAPDANALPIAKDMADLAMDSATCIGCGACVASCPNGSAALFTGAKISQYTFLPQGQPERRRRALRMVAAMDEAGFGNCSNHAECEAVCPKGISIGNIARMRREYMRAALTRRDD
ncbi:MAG TPA: succinate dehydrogenase/fumarate reductase iron-sulfur subunit [Acidobacteriota bacterium]|nr:succinate dehydrogenase/fumarate reductase iron-sulfur subunit [Acidobacteriota bacterium]